MCSISVPRRGVVDEPVSHDPAGPVVSRITKPENCAGGILRSARIRFAAGRGFRLETMPIEAYAAKFEGRGSVVIVE